MPLVSFHGQHSLFLLKSKTFHASSLLCDFTCLFVSDCLSYYLALNILLLPKNPKNILFAITAAGFVLCDGPKKSPRTSSIVQIIFFFQSFEISKDIQSDHIIYV